MITTELAPAFPAGARIADRAWFAEHKDRKLRIRAPIDDEYRREFRGFCDARAKPQPGHHLSPAGEHDAPGRTPGAGIGAVRPADGILWRARLASH